MPNCRACGLPDRESLDQALLAGRGSLRTLAKQFGVSVAGLFRHKQHLPMNEVQAAEAAADAGKDELLSAIDRVVCELRGLQSRAKRLRNAQDALAVSRELRAWFTLKAKLTPARRLGGNGRNGEDNAHSSAGTVRRLTAEKADAICERWQQIRARVPKRSSQASAQVVDRTAPTRGSSDVPKSTLSGTGEPDE
jgi:hypothetical protein